MKDRERFWLLKISLILLLLCLLFYVLHYLIFHDLHHILIYFIGDLAFLFLNVLIVVILIEKLLQRRDQQNRKQKLNMIIGLFMSEVGLRLLEKMPGWFNLTEDIRKALIFDNGWKYQDFKLASRKIGQINIDPKIVPEDLAWLQVFLKGKQDFLLRLLENPNLLEHESFTDTLWAIFHLQEELVYRGDRILELPESDYLHLKTDLKRAYATLVQEWLFYAAHLKEKYPYLYSLVVRINPFKPSPSPVILEK